MADNLSHSAGEHYVGCIHFWSTHYGIQEGFGYFEPFAPPSSGSSSQAQLAIPKMPVKTAIGLTETRLRSLIPSSVHFPGAVNSSFTSALSFTRPNEKDAMPTFRILDQDGVIVDKSQNHPETSKEELLKMYKDMVTVSIMDIIMFDAQRQGRISFYMVSAGEEGIAVGSASSLSPNDPIFAQYRETGIFQYRGFTPSDFMAQLFATTNDPGRGRNMPVHYGSTKFKVHTISSPLATQIPQAA
ncbi:thiamine diphosphate-binding protein, partial [Hortaea werneckii]